MLNTTRNLSLPAVFLCFLAHVTSASAQAPATPEDESAWGGPAVTPGSLPLSSAPHPNASSACPSNDPCVLTGQYNRSRTNTNFKAANLGGMASPEAFENFGLAYLYPVAHAASGRGYEPIVAQPLYITHVPVQNVPPAMCNGTGFCNMLLVGSLSDWLYAFDTSTPPEPGEPNYLWPPINLATAPGHCSSLTGGPFVVNHNGFPGVNALAYYGIVATPVVDNAPQHPTAFVTSACVDTPSSAQLRWYIDSIDLVTGQIVATAPLTDTGRFNAPNEISRPSLLLTHPTTGTTYIYVTFGTGVREIGAEDGSGGAGFRYSGTVFVLPYTYPNSPASFGTPLTPFYSTCTKSLSECAAISGSFPAAYTSTDGNGYPTGPAGGTGCTSPCCATGTCCILPTPPPGNVANSTCSMGSNWAVNGGGCWMSSRGPASSSTGDAILACGNGAFACAGTGAGQTGCLTASAVNYFGQSAIELPPASAPNPTVPVDFFAPNQQRYACPPSQQPACLGYMLANADPHPAAYQTEELSRLDQDIGTGGIVGIATPSGTFFVTADKTGMVYVMPPPAGETSGSSMGKFQKSDAGLTGSGLTYATQAPFQASRYPDSTHVVCPSLNNVGRINYGKGSCDEVHEIAYENNLMFIWPSNETIMAYKGTYTAGTSSTPTTYKFGARYDPCGGALSCDGFPASNPNSEGGAMAVAVDTTTPTSTCTKLPCASLWSIVPQSYGAGDNAAYLWGTLYAYSIGSAPSLTYLWDSFSPEAPKCAEPPATGWITTSFTEPTVADVQQTSGARNSAVSYGAVYVPTVCAITDGEPHADCPSAVKDSAAASGVLVFTNCPPGPHRR